MAKFSSHDRSKGFGLTAVAQARWLCLFVLVAARARQPPLLRLPGLGAW